MSKKSNEKITAMFVLSISFIVLSATTFFLSLYYRNICFQMLGKFCGGLIRKYPDVRPYILEQLKTQNFYDANGSENILSVFGYHSSNLEIMDTTVLWIAVLVFLAGGFLFLFSFWYWHRMSALRIQTLTDYLEKINTGGQGLLLDTSEDEFSRLQDEIYKTVTTLYQTRDAALTARNRFAENLSNIAHQLKTPITAISLSVQMVEERIEDSHVHEIKQQIKRLTHLEEELLLLSRIDAGTLVLNQKSTDVFTLLTMASDNLYELFIQKNVLVEIPEESEITILVDADWTMEAVMNLMKNCMEASKSGTTVHCSYEQNPLYVQIRIWDEGQGFEKEDLPHLFERFYQGKGDKENGIGIGLSLSKSIIEMQNGILRAFNLPEGGACFEIRFYSH